MGRTVFIKTSASLIWFRTAKSTEKPSETSNPLCQTNRRRRKRGLSAADINNPEGFLAESSAALQRRLIVNRD
jgi:hypothetical protein